jgi:hypothetical protein
MDTNVTDTVRSEITDIMVGACTASIYRTGSVYLHGGSIGGGCTIIDPEHMDDAITALTAARDASADLKPLPVAIAEASKLIDQAKKLLLPVEHDLGVEASAAGDADEDVAGAYVDAQTDMASALGELGGVLDGLRLISSGIATARRYRAEAAKSRAAA